MALLILPRALTLSHLHLKGILKSCVFVCDIFILLSIDLFGKNKEKKRSLSL